MLYFKCYYYKVNKKLNGSKLLLLYSSIKTIDGNCSNYVVVTESHFLGIIFFNFFQFF